MAAVLPPTRLPKPPPGSLAPSRGRSAASGGFEEWPQVLITPSQTRAGERSAAQPSRPEAPPAPRGSAGDCFCLALAEAAFGSRAHRAASSQPIRRYSRVPSVPRPPRAGPVRCDPLPAFRDRLSLLPSLSTSSTPRGVAPPRPPSPPPPPPERVLSFPFSLLPSSRLGSRARRSGTVAADFPPGRTPPRVPLRQPQRVPPAVAASPPASGSRARTPPRPAASRAPAAASPGRRRTGPRPPPPASLPPAHLALALSRGPRRARSRPRAPSSRFSRLLSVR